MTGHPAAADDGPGPGGPTHPRHAGGAPDTDSSARGSEEEERETSLSRYSDGSGSTVVGDVGDTGPAAGAGDHGDFTVVQDSGAGRPAAAGEIGKAGPDGEGFAPGRESDRAAGKKTGGEGNDGDGGRSV